MLADLVVLGVRERAKEGLFLLSRVWSLIDPLHSSSYFGPISAFLGPILLPWGLWAPCLAVLQCGVGQGPGAGAQVE